MAKPVALQNISVELFNEEARKLIPGEKPAPRIPGMAWIGRWSYWVTNADGKVFGRGTAWFQIWRDGNKLVLSTHADRSGGPKAEWRGIDDNSLEIHFHDPFRNYMRVRRTSPNTIPGQHCSPRNTNTLYAWDAAKVEGHKK